MAARFINCLKPLFPFMKLCCSYIHKSPCPAPVTSGPANRRITDRAWRMKTVMMMVLLPMCPFHSSTRLTRLVVLKPCLLFFLLCYFTLFVILPCLLFNLVCYFTFDQLVFLSNSRHVSGLMVHVPKFYCKTFMTTSLPIIHAV